MKAETEKVTVKGVRLTDPAGPFVEMYINTTSLYRSMSGLFIYFTLEEVETLRDELRLAVEEAERAQ